jgi:hypothetical protein
MRRFGMAVLAGFAVMAVALVTQSVASSDAADWLALVAVALALAGIVSSGIRWVMTKSESADPAGGRNRSCAGGPDDMSRPI